MSKKTNLLIGSIMTQRSSKIFLKASFMKYLIDN